MLCYLGGLAALQGNYDEARELHGRGRGIFEELGHAVGIAGSTTVSGPIELLAGDPAAAERELRFGYDAFEAMGETGILSSLAALLAEAVLAQGRSAEAEELTRVSERAATADDAASQIAWRTVRGCALARRGEVDEAHRLAADAVEPGGRHGLSRPPRERARGAGGGDAGVGGRHRRREVPGGRSGAVRREGCARRGRLRLTGHDAEESRRSGALSPFDDCLLYGTCVACAQDARLYWLYPYPNHALRSAFIG